MVGHQRNHCAFAQTLVGSNQVSLIVSIVRAAIAVDNSRVCIGKYKRAVAGHLSMPTNE
jgi:hypothetical protein